MTTPALLRLLAQRAAAGRRLVVPIEAGQPQPLCSAFRREALNVVQAHIDAGDRKIMSVAGDLDVDRLAPHEWAGRRPGGTLVRERQHAGRIRGRREARAGTRAPPRPNRIASFSTTLTPLRAAVDAQLGVLSIAFVTMDHWPRRGRAATWFAGGMVRLG